MAGPCDWGPPTLGGFQPLERTARPFWRGQDCSLVRLGVGARTILATGLTRAAAVPTRGF
eukprot:2233996-Alexandrium_andersonii.AAC.1